MARAMRDPPVEGQMPAKNSKKAKAVKMSMPKAVAGHVAAAAAPSESECDIGSSDGSSDSEHSITGEVEEGPG
eukprot:12417432-Karenia_brevis.AAC.1